MKSRELLNEIEESIDLPPGTLKGTERLEDIEGWDSLAVIMFIALVDEKMGLAVEGEKLVTAETLHDVLGLVKQGLDDYPAAA